MKKKIPNGCGLVAQNNLIIIPLFIYQMFKEIKNILKY